MRKFSLLVLLGIFLVGCSDQTINQEMHNYRSSVTYDNANKNQFYEENESMHAARQEIKRAIEDYQNQAQKDENNIRIRYSSNEEFENKLIGVYYTDLSSGVDYEKLLHNKVIQDINKELLPGVTEFITNIAAEKEKLAPQAMVTNNNWAIMYPIHLYGDDDMSYHGVPLIIGINDIDIKDEYLKRLIEKVDATEFIVHEPVVSDEAVILQFSTPFYYANTDDDIVDNVKINGQSLYGGPNMSFRLYIKDSQLEEIHIVTKEIGSEFMTVEDLNAVIEWAKEEWQVDECTIEVLKNNFDLMLAGKLDNKKDTIGQLQYSYAVKSRNYRPGNISEYTLKKRK